MTNNSASGLSFMAKMQQKIQRAQQQGYVAPRRGGTSKAGCVTLYAVVHECRSGTISWTKNGATESKEKMEYKGALKGVVGLVDKFRRAWDKRILEALDQVHADNRTDELADDPFFRMAKAYYDEARCGPGATSQEDNAHWAAQVRAAWELALEHEEINNTRACELAEELSMPYVPVADDAIRFVSSMADKEDEGGRTHELPRQQERETFVVREGDTHHKIESIGGARTRPFTVIEIGAFGFTRVNKGTYAGRFFSRSDNINVDVEDSNLGKGARMQRFIDEQHQRIVPRDDDRFDPRTFLLSIDKANNAPDAVPQPTEAPGLFSTVFYEGYEKREGEQGGQSVENSPESFRFRPDANDSQELSVTPGLGMQLAVTQWGPAVDGNLDERTYFEQLRVSLRLYWQQCIDQPFLQLEQWCAHMMADPIPLLAAWGIHGLKTYEKNASLIPGTADGAQVVGMIRDVHWQVAKFILERCVPVSAAWVRQHFGDEDYLENNETITYRYEDKRTNVIEEQAVTKKFSKNEKESQKEAGEVKLINLSDYTGKLGRFVSKKGEPNDGWQFVVAVAEVEVDRKNELVMHSELPQELPAEDRDSWPADAAAGDELLTALEKKPRASSQKLVVTVLAHKFAAEDCEPVEPHPVYALHRVPPSNTHAEPVGTAPAAPPPPPPANAAAAAVEGEGEGEGQGPAAYDRMEEAAVEPPAPAEEKKKEPDAISSIDSDDMDFDDDNNIEEPKEEEEQEQENEEKEEEEKPAKGGSIGRNSGKKRKRDADDKESGTTKKKKTKKARK